MEIIIKGEPIAQKRPRFYRRGNHVGVYNPQETEAGRWLLEAKSQITERIHGPLVVVIEAVFSRPRSHYGTGRNSGGLKASAPGPYTGKPDIDNVVKFSFDCLNGEAWDDDKQVVSLSAFKRYAVKGEEARTEIKIFRA